MSPSSLARHYPFPNSSFTANVSVVLQLSTVVVPRTNPISASVLYVLTRLILPKTYALPLSVLRLETPVNKIITTGQYPSAIRPKCYSWMCQINVESVRLLYWPIENSTISSQNGSLASASSSQYTTVSNGFTLYVCLSCRQQ